MTKSSIAPMRNQMALNSNNSCCQVSMIVQKLAVSKGAVIRPAVDFLRARRS